MKTIDLTCDYCNIHFKCLLKAFKSRKKNGGKHSFCSLTCRTSFYKTETSAPCAQCGKNVIRNTAEMKTSKTGNRFCDNSCAASFNNAHKTSGTRISKLEKWLATELIKKYSTLEFHFNRKDAINSELDIYIPSLKLAFELNGIFHYEPIYGKDKLTQIQNNDSRKFQACLEQGIELCIIDTSSFKRFKPSGAIKYLNIIFDVIDQKSTT